MTVVTSSDPKRVAFSESKQSQSEQWRVFPTEDAQSEDEISLTHDLFSRIFRDKPERAVHLVKRNIFDLSADTTKLLPKEAVRLLLSELRARQLGAQNLLVTSIFAIGRAKDIVEAARSLYRSGAGEDLVVLAANLLEQYGESAWNSLRTMARISDPLCRFFVRQIALCEGVPEEERLDAIVDLAKHEDEEVRRAVTEVLDEDLLEDSTVVWKILREDPLPELRDLAVDRLSEIEEA